MKKLIFFLMLGFITSCFSNPVIFFNPATGRVTDIKTRCDIVREGLADTNGNPLRNDVIIYNCDAKLLPSILPSCDRKYWIVSDGQVVEMNASQKAVIDAEIQAQIDQIEADKKDLDKQDKILEACILVLLDEINSERQWIESFKTAVANATTLANLKTGVAALPAMPDRTKAQAKTAIINKYNSL